MVKMKSYSAVEAIRGQEDYFLEDPSHTYIRVYGSEVKPYLFPRYANNRLILMEFYRQLLFMHENIWKKKNAARNLPISIEEYTCSTWQEAKEMRTELSYYHFCEVQATSHYDLEGRIQVFYKRAFRKTIIYEHKSLGDKERYKNKREDKQIQEVHQVLAAEGWIDWRIQNLSKPQATPSEKSTSSTRVRRRQGQIGKHATLGSSGLEIHFVVKEITKDFHIIAETGYPYFPLQQLEDATPKNFPIKRIMSVRAENPLAIPNLLTPAEDHAEIEFPEPIKVEA